MVGSNWPHIGNHILWKLWSRDRWCHLPQMVTVLLWGFVRYQQWMRVKPNGYSWAVGQITRSTERISCSPIKLLVCLCWMLCTIVLHNTAEYSAGSLSSYPSDNHHSSDDVYWSGYFVQNVAECDVHNGGNFTLSGQQRLRRMETVAWKLPHWTQYVVKTFHHFVSTIFLCTLHICSSLVRASSHFVLIVDRFLLKSLAFCYIMVVK